MNEKLKINLSDNLDGKSKEEIDAEREEMINLLFEYYGECDCEITAPLIDTEKSDLKYLSDSVYVMSKGYVIAMGFDWEDSKHCKLERQIAEEFGIDIIYLDTIKKELGK